MLKEIFNPAIIEAVSKYSVGFILLLLAAFNIYQFVDGKNEIQRRDEEIKRLNEVSRLKDEKAYEYEQQRNARYEFLMNNLPKVKDDEKK